MKTVPGGLAAPLGFRSAGAYCGIKRKRNDLALIVSDRDAVAAGVFTQNVVRASCVIANQNLLPSENLRAIVVNSGNANACNGESGDRDNERMAELTAQSLGIDRTQVFTASTGIIGTAMPMDKVEAGITLAVAKLDDENSDAAAEAIMTTDTFPKQFSVEMLVGSKPVRIGAIAKGSGMIAPNMATMLGFIVTDVNIEQAVLQEMLTRCVWYTFNSITVDGDTSTNDMVLVLANGAAENRPIVGLDSQDGAIFETALYNVCLHLAKEVARDGEGATKLVSVTVKNVLPPKALTEAYESSGRDLTKEQRASFARSVAKTIANSPLVKTALFGNDPNWGRILAAAGRSGVQFDQSTIEISLAGHCVYKAGMPTDFDHELVSKSMKGNELDITVDLNQTGGEQATVWTCDFSYEYVKINAEYHT
jgi:glutamate N-acetyltransferase / amino-acid N-acetyltransferase